ncbi:MAG: GTPase HflX [Cyclobacteriaceae bacterium]|nr:GTPase HflX [Cyclobacteriaceae bacterium]
MGFETDQKEADKAILVGLITDQVRQAQAEEYIDELEFLALTAKIETVKKVFQRLPRPDLRYYIGSGKLEEIKIIIETENVNCLIFDDDLSPSQIRNLERETKVRIYDRSLLILDIFLDRAQTAQAKTQVELARYQYILPRLTRMWTHLERQRGGTGTRGGAGEKEIETDRRMIRDQIKVLKTRLVKIEKQMKVQRKHREGIVRVSFVGYTNVGKSTLMNLIAKSKVKEEDKLFATVDSTVRKVFLNGIQFLLSDTVGFIRKLPHHLIESFKSTLDEIKEADVLIHVVDISYPFHQNQIEVVEKTLKELGVVDKPVLYVYNKVDKLSEEEREDLQVEKGIFVSATTGQNIDEFKKTLFKLVEKEHYKIYPNYINPETHYSKDIYSE